MQSSLLLRAAAPGASGIRDGLKTKFPSESSRFSSNISILNVWFGDFGGKKHVPERLPATALDQARSAEKLVIKLKGWPWYCGDFGERGASFGDFGLSCGALGC
jgi:hypothetical protein